MLRLRSCIWCAAALASAILAADELSLVPREGVVLLTNGELIEGKIIAAGDRYDIHLEAGEISIPRGRVAMICRDAEECYRRQHDAVEPGRAQSHLELAQWCIKNQLFEQAEREWEMARSAEPAHPALRLVKSRLELAQAPPASDPPAARPQAGHAADTSTANLPAGTVENFTNIIQPMLLNYCAKGGCHAGRGQGDLALERMHPKLTARSTTQRNLKRVLALVDRHDPSQSRLLAAPIAPHGGGTAPVFTQRDAAQYKQLARWVFALASHQPASPPPTLDERTAPLLQPAGAAEPLPTASLLPAEQATAPAESPGEQSGDLAGEQGLAPDQGLTRARGLERSAAANLRYGAPQTEFVPKDPFDPEIFNRRFFGR